MAQSGSKSESPDDNVFRPKRQFFGTLCGDFYKNRNPYCSLPCGALIGAACDPWRAGQPAFSAITFCSQTLVANGSPETTATVEQVVTALGTNDAVVVVSNPTQQTAKPADIQLFPNYRSLTHSENVCANLISIDSRLPSVVQAIM